MNARACAVLWLCFVCEASFADTLVMKSGENKKGKILEETEETVLFNSQADGVVFEVPRSSVAIVDRDVQSENPSSKGSLQVFSVSPKKKTDKILPEQKQGPLEMFSGTEPAVTPKKETSGQAASFQSFMKLIEDWVRSHPEAEKTIQEWMHKFKGNQDDLDKLVKAAKEA